VNDPALVWFDGAGALYEAPIPRYCGSAMIVASAGSGTIQGSGTLQCGAPPEYGLEILGPQFANLPAGTVSATGLPGGSVTPIDGGVHVSAGAALRSSFAFTLSNLHPFAASDALSTAVFGTDGNSAETIWLNAATQY
jgi:hypothetical protein